MCKIPTLALSTCSRRRRWRRISFQNYRIWESEWATLWRFYYDGDTPAEHGRQSGNKGALFSRIRICSMPESFLTIQNGLASSKICSSCHDELHYYRGVFGSHLANVLRRLRRITRFYGSNPQFIFSSATIANPGELAAKLIEGEVKS